MHTKSTAASYKPRVKLTSHRGWYRVQSGTTPGVYYQTSANSCNCPARKPCKHQKFVRALNVAFFVKKEASLAMPQPATTSGRCIVCGEHDHYLRAGLCVLCEMDASEAPVEAPVVVPMTAGAPSGIVRPVRGNPYAGLDAEIAQAERFLEIERRALLDTHPQDDSYAPLLRQVDMAERAVAALNYSTMRAA